MTSQLLQDFSKSGVFLVPFAIVRRRERAVVSGVLNASTHLPVSKTLPGSRACNMKCHQQRQHQTYPFLSLVSRQRRGERAPSSPLRSIPTRRNVHAKTRLCMQRIQRAPDGLSVYPPYFARLIFLIQWAAHSENPQHFKGRVRHTCAPNAGGV